jgi:hypothetical protein
MEATEKPPTAFAFVYKISIVGFTSPADERDESEVVLHISTNAGLSSSVLPLARHGEAWLDVSYSRDITMPSTSLPMFVRKEGLDLSEYQALVIDTQGTELRICAARATYCRALSSSKSRFQTLRHRSDRLAYQVNTDFGTYYDITYARSRYCPARLFT